MTAGLVQGTDEWRQARLGKLTASRVADALATTKTGWGASRANLIAELVVERLTGRPTDGYTNEAMRWGTEHEADARAAYEFWANAEVELVGFVDHPLIAMSGASPDGLVGENGLVEIKCPSSATHIETLLGGTVPHKYQLQMNWQMACTCRAYCDFVSFDPRMPGDMQLYVKRFHRMDKETEADLAKQVVDFLSEVDGKLAALAAKFDRREAA